ncbi:sulfatase [Thermococcus sp.]
MLKETMLKSPLKGILHRAYRMKKEEEYRKAFEKRIVELQRRAGTLRIENKINVLIVVADCLRFKNTSLSGYDRDTTPFLASLKNSGKATSTAPWTHPSVASIMTGLYPHNHGAYIHSKLRNFDNPKNFRGIRKDILTLPEIAALNGYNVYFATSIDVASFPMKGRAPLRLYPAETNGDKIIKDFLNWLDKKGESFFAYLHLGDTHEPLNPPETFKNYFGRVKKLRNIERWAFQRPEEQKGREFEEFKENKILLYDNTVRYVDYLFEGIHGELEKRGLLENTLLFFTGDHGEEFWEHGELEAKHFYDPRGIYGVGHGHNVFNEIIEIPLAVEGPLKGLKTENRSLVDLAPTILEAWKVELPYLLDGSSLRKKPKRFLLSEATGYGYEKKSFIIGNLKFLYAPEDGVEWIFFLNRDPNEREPIKDRDVIDFMRKKLLSILVRDEIRLKNSIR